MDRGDLPETIGRYRPVEELGRGSMARVLLAEDPNTDRRVALKVVAPTAEAEDEAQRRFLLEARAAGRLNHPGIVTIYDADVDPETGDAYMAMEWVRGRSLAQRLEEEGPPPRHETVRIASAVAAALDHAHGREVIHRDVKPANILLGDDGAVKVSDFGIAKFVAESHTLWGQVLGSPNYMSPEQVTGEPMDGRSDLFSLGAVVYEMLTGVPPFRGDSVASIVYKIAHVDPRPPSFQDPTIGPALDEVVLRTLDKKPAGRYRTGAELAQALGRGLEADAAVAPVAGRSRSIDGADRAVAPEEPETALAGTLVEASAAPAATVETVEADERPDRLRSRWSRRGLRVAAAAGIVLILGAAGLALWHRSPPESPPDSGAPSPGAAEAGLRGAPDAGPSSVDGAPDATASAESAPIESVEGSVARPPPPSGAESSAGSSAPSPSPIDEPVETDESSGPEEARTATLRLVYNNRLEDALLTVWVDGDRTLSYRVGAENILSRVTGDELTTSLQLEAGMRTIEVRVTGVEGRKDASGVIRSRFRDGETRRLRVVLRPFGSNLRLAWEDQEL